MMYALGLAVVLGGLVFLALILLGCFRESRFPGGSFFSAGEGSKFGCSRSKTWVEEISAVKPPGWVTEQISSDMWEQAEVGYPRRAYLGAWWTSLILLGLIFTLLQLFGPGGWLRHLFEVLALVGVGVFPFAHINWRVRKREEALQKSFPDFLDFLKMAVQAGLGFLPALKRVSGGLSGPLPRELSDVIRQVELGYALESALDHWAEKMNSEDVSRFVEAVNLSQKLGTPLSRTLEIQADLLRARRRRQAEVKAQTTPIRIIPALVFFFLPSLLLIYLAPPVLRFLLSR